MQWAILMHMSKPKQTRLLTAEDAAGVLQVHRATVLRLAHAGLLEPAFRGPGRTGVYMFHPADVDRLLKARSKSSAVRNSPPAHGGSVPA